jgi:hypothetical protein
MNLFIQKLQPFSNYLDFHQIYRLIQDQFARKTARQEARPGIAALV